MYSCSDLGVGKTRRSKMTQPIRHIKTLLHGYSSNMCYMLKFIDMFKGVRSTPTNAHQDWFQDKERQFAPDSANYLFVPFTGLWCNFLGDMSMEHWTLFTHTPRHSENQWGKGTVFDVHNAPVILAFFLLFVLSKNVFCCKMGLRWRVGVGYSNVEQEAVMLEHGSRIIG